MQEASIRGLWFILVLILGYYAFKWLARVFLPILMQKVVRNFEQKAKEQQGYTNPSEHVREGETIIDKKPEQRRKSDNSVGEYVDFEEVEE